MFIPDTILIEAAYQQRERAKARAKRWQWWRY